MADKPQTTALEDGIERLIREYESNEDKLVIGVTITRQSEKSFRVSALVIPRHEKRARAKATAS